MIVILLVVIISLLLIALGFICWAIFFFLSKTFQLMVALDAKNTVHQSATSDQASYNRAVLNIMKGKKTGDSIAQRQTSVNRITKDDQLTRLEDMPFDDAYEALEKVANDGITR